MFLILFFFIYQVFHIIFSPAILFYIIIRFFKKKSLGSWKERLGFVLKTKKSDHIIWIHAVSVGEVLSIEHFISMCKREHPNVMCYLTCGTLTGIQVAKKTGADYISFMPFDFLMPMLLAFHRIEPKAIVIVESEIWPNFLMLAQFKKIPLYLLNGRINTTSARRRRFMGFLYKLFTKILVPSKRTAEQFLSLDIPQNKISVIGDIKSFNVVEKKTILTNHTIQPLPYTIILAGSIHEQELDIYLNLYINLRNAMPNVRLILAPRHFNWQQELVNKLKSYTISYELWTDTNSIQELDKTILNLFAQHEVLVVCKLGLLFSLYPFATLYCLGGTFVNVGGHNLLEPAVWAKPCLIGPYYHMCFDVAEQLYMSGGLIKVTSAQELQPIIEKLIQNPIKLSNMGKINETWIIQQAEKTKIQLNNFIKNIKPF